MNSKQTVHRPSPVASLSYFVLFFLVFVAPLSLQMGDFGRKFQSVCGYMRTPGELVHATLIACAVVSFLGLIIFESWRKFAWCAFMLVFALAVLRSELTRRAWPIWDSVWDYPIYQSCLLQVVVLGLVPVQVWLWNRKQPTVEWARLSLGFVASFQALVTVLQFFMIRHGHRDLLGEWGLDTTTFYTPRDSTNVYREAGRLTGLTTSPTLLGMILVLTWPALLIERRRGSKAAPSPGETALKILLIFSVIWAIILTYTRASYIGLGLQVIAISVLALRQGLLNPRFIISRLNLLVIAAAIGSALLFIPASGARVGAIADSADASITNRLAVYQVAGKLISERPVSGWGPGFFNVLYNNFYKLSHVGYSFFDTHSATINTFMEIGVVGVLIGVIALCGIHWKAVFRRTPVWIWIAVLGAALPITMDNPSSSPAFMFPAVWVFGVICVTSVSIWRGLSRLDVRRCKRFTFSRSQVLGLATLLFALWLVAFMQSLKPLEQHVAKDVHGVTR